MPPLDSASGSHLNLESRFGAPRVKNLPRNHTRKFDFVAWFLHYLHFFIPPVFNWAPKYQLRWFLNDLISGISSGVYCIPQSMALGTLAGLSPTYGLYASLAPPIVYILLGPSRSLAIGPASVISLLVGSATANSAHPALLATTMSFFMGVGFLVLGILRLGFLASIISRPIVVGFTAAAAILVNTTQIKDMLGISVKSNNNLIEWFQRVPSAIHNGPVNGWAAVMSVSCLFFLIALRFHPRLRLVPGPLVVSVFCILITWGFQLQRSAGLSIVGAIETGLPEPASPFLPASEMSSMASDLVVIAAVSLVELVSISRTFAVKAGTIVSTNSELFAVGAASFIGSFFRAMPVSASFSRTALNESTGAKSQLGAVISTLLVIFVLCFANDAIYYLPKATLAAIVIGATLNLFEIAEMKFIYRTSKRDFFILCLAFFVTVIAGAQYGVLVSVCFNLFFMLFDQFRLKTGEVGQLPHYVTDTLFDVIHPDLIAEEGAVNAAALENSVEEGDLEPLSPKTTPPNRSDALFVLRKHFPQSFVHPHLYIVRPADSLTYVNIDSWVVHTVSDATARLTPQWNVEDSDEFYEVQEVYLAHRAEELASKDLEKGVARAPKDAPPKNALHEVGRSIARRARQGSKAPAVRTDRDREDPSRKSLENSIEMSLVEATVPKNRPASANAKRGKKDATDSPSTAPQSPSDDPSFDSGPSMPRNRSLTYMEDSASMPRNRSNNAMDDYSASMPRNRSLSIIDEYGEVREAAEQEVDPTTETQVEEESKSKSVLEFAERTHRLEGFVIVDMIHVSSMDSVVVGRLKDLHKTLAANYLSLALARPRPEVLRYLILGGFVQLIGQDFVVGSVASCVIRCTAVLRAAKRFQALNILKMHHEPENLYSNEEEDSSDYLARSTRAERDERNRRARTDSMTASYVTGEESIVGDENV